MKVKNIPKIVLEATSECRKQKPEAFMSQIEHNPIMEVQGKEFGPKMKDEEGSGSSKKTRDLFTIS